MQTAAALAAVMVKVVVVVQLTISEAAAAGAAAMANGAVLAFCAGVHGWALAQQVHVTLWLQASSSSSSS
jgi:hypothetical protein